MKASQKPQFFIDCEEQMENETHLSGLLFALEESVQTDVPLAIEALFVSAEEIRELNARTRGVDKVTDVLSFPSLDNIRAKALKKADFPLDIDEEGRLFLGSVVICKQRAQEQAEEYGHSYLRELTYLLVHGIMHCLGYDHMTDEDKTQMRAMEELVLGKMGITRE